MKIKNLQVFVLLLFCTLGFHQLNAQLVKDVSITAEEANFQMIAPNSYLLEIGGADGYYFKEEIEYTKNISIGNVRADGKKFPDGPYVMQVTPIVKLSDAERQELRALQSANDQEKIAAFRQNHNLPGQVDVYNVYFSIRNGQFVTPDQKETQSLKLPTMSGVWQQDHPALYASLDNVSVNYGTPMAGGNKLPAMDNSSADDDQVFVDDVIINGGSLCVGLDCVNGESFGSDTERLKENNLRIHFDDTSNSASFPKNDWRLTANDQTNGGAEYFSIDDATAGTTPFRVMAGAGNNALYISNSGGNVGLGTASPVVELHVTDGDSPTMRLEQNGSNGWTPQTWDVAGNETNFFVRDVTNGSKLPFKIKPGAPDNSIYIDADGDIGLGTANPGSNALQVESGDVYIKNGKVGINKAPSSTLELDVLGDAQFEGSTLFKGDASFFMTLGSSFLSPSFVTVLRIDAANNRVGIGTQNPDFDLEVCGTIAATNTTVSMSTSCSSDIRYKKNIQSLESSLEKLMQLRGVSYNWKVADFPKKGFNDEIQIGFIAQEMETLFPELVITDAKGYKAVDYAKVTPILVEAVKEQQNIIESQQEEIAALQKEVADLNDLKAQVAALTGMVSNLNKTDDSAEEAVGEKE